MRRRLVAAPVVLALVLGLAAYVARDDLARLRSIQTLFDETRIVANFSHMDTMFHTVPMPAPVHEPSPLPRAPVRATLPEGFAAWVADHDVTSALVLRRGEVVFEEYYLGTTPDDLRVSWSIGKSVLATLLGISVLNGEIASIDDPVTKYAPALAGSAYEGPTIRNLLNMASGVDFDEDYADFWSDINRMGRVLALGGSLDAFAAGLDQTRAPPGTRFDYVSMDSHVLGMVLRGATGKTIPELMNERLFTPMRLDADPYYLADSTGTAFVLGGLNMTTRDYARFGELVLERGRAADRQIVPETWIREMTRGSAPNAPQGGYGYQWWLPDNAHHGEVYAGGLYGQYVWIDARADVVIVITAADRRYAAEGVRDQAIAMLRAIVEEVR